jgi:hypothetical protein
VQAYNDAYPAGQAIADTLACIVLATNAAGNILGWGVVVPLYAVAIGLTPEETSTSRRQRIPLGASFDGLETAAAGDGPVRPAAP